MFSGIVEERAEVVDLSRSSEITRLTIASRLNHSGTRIGDSIALDGACLTVVQVLPEADACTLSFELAAETVRRTTLGELAAGDYVNLERALLSDGRIHGHFVSGHVDCVSRLLSRVSEGKSERYEWELPEVVSHLVASKGSVTLSGVSLTVGEITSQSSFFVYIIPHTAEITTLSEKKPGDSVNVEADMLARYLARLVVKGKAGAQVDEAITYDLLARHGFVEEEK